MYIDYYMNSRSETTIDSIVDKYMLTISCQQKKHLVIARDIVDVIVWLKHSIETLKFVDNAFESSGKYQQLHFHSIVEVHRPFRYSPFTQFGDTAHCHNTFSINWKKLTYPTGARSYVYKDI